MSWEIFQIGKHVEVLGRGHTWRGCGSSEPPTFPIPCLICISLIWLSLYNKPVIVFQSFSHVLLFWDSMDCSTPGFLVLHHLQELAQTHVHWVSDAIQPSHLLSSPSPPAFSPSQHQSFLMSQPFTSGGQSIVVSASASVLPILGLISFRIDWLDLLAIQETLKSFLQHHILKASILQHPAFFMVQLSTSIHDYWKNHSFD